MLIQWLRLRAEELGQRLHKQQKKIYSTHKRRAATTISEIHRYIYIHKRRVAATTSEIHRYIFIHLRAAAIEKLNGELSIVSSPEVC